MLRRVPWALGALLLGSSGCMELDVSNPNNPDRVRATATPLDIQTIITSSFSKFFQDVSQETRAVAVSAIADEFSSNFLDFGQYDLSREPREAYINQTSYAYASAASLPWIEMYAVISSANDGLAAIELRDVLVTVPACGDDDPTDQTTRAKAFAKFVQGLAHGWVALSYDQGFVSDEFRDLENDPPALQPHAAVMDSAIVFLRQAIDIAESESFELCAEDNFISGIDLTNLELAELAHTMIARFMVYRARTPAERADVNWTDVLAELDAGIDRDINPVGVPDVMESGYKFLIARQRSTTPSDHTRIDYNIVGPADTLGRWQTWVNSATTSTDRTAFQLATPDRRINDGSPTARGTYAGYFSTLLGNAARGLYLRSHYAYYRTGTGQSYRSGPLLWLTTTELDLLRAEALIRLDREDEALPLINATRVANGQLPPVTVDGPPNANSCVPQKMDGTCGSLWDALRYEKRLEMLGVDPWIQWYDARGWGMLPQGALVHYPVPARELQILELPGYTTGGTNPGSAAAPDPERCPTALPRCPA